MLKFLKTDMQDNKSVYDKQSRWKLLIARLCTERFDQREIRSKSAVMSEKDLVILDPDDALRGHWNNRCEFLLSCIGFAVGLGNVWRFPIKVYRGGGGAFLIPYTILCLIMGVPLLLLELGLGQFSSKTPVHAFKMVPILYGIGWAMVLLIISVEIYYGVIIAYSYFYLFGSLSPTLPWTLCSHSFNTANCLETSRDMKFLNKSFKYVSSTSQYWDYYVTGFYKSPSNIPYSMNEPPGSPQWHLSACLFLVWACNAGSVMFGVQISGKIMYFTVLFPYMCLFTLIILGSTLPGAFTGLKFYLKPKWSMILDPETLRGAVEQLFFSSCIGLGGMITYSSYNDFKDNVYRDAIIIIAVDYATSFISGFAVFPMIGYMAFRNNVPIEKVITSGTGLFFITYPEALGSLRWGNLWTMILMIMAICLGLDSQFADLETVTSSIMDTFPIIRQTKYRKASFILFTCFIFFLAGLIFCTPGGTYYFDIMDMRISSYGIPLMAMSEAVVVGLIYGMRQFRYDLRLMLGFSLSWYWFITMAIVCPVIIILIIFSSIVMFQRIEIAGSYIPLWGEALSFMVLFVCLLPIFIAAVHVTITYRRKYPDLHGMKFIRKLFEPPIYWGPHFMKDWLAGSFYRNKMLKYKDDPEFLKHVPDSEDFDAIVQMAELKQ